MTEQNKEEILEIDADQLQDLMSDSELDKLPPIVLDVENYDADEFELGIKESSYISGVITALLNTGVSEGFVLDYILNKETVKHNLEIAQINKEIAKNHKVASDKYEL